ncbi:MAG TPA: hypothetical protein VMY39_05785 [Planctomycetota bacterium]|nr:hypothetical protein [Planctomycetota bacterium]
MHRNAGIAGLLVVVVLGSVSARVLADDVESGWDGKDLVPIDSKAIRMAREEVDVQVRWSKSDAPEDKDVLDGHCPVHVTGSWVLVNDSDEPQSILVSFPNNFDVHDFARTVDGKPVKVDKVPGKEYSWASKIDFAPRQERRVRVTYTAFAESTGGNLGGYWAYILQTGAHWKGKIGKAVIRVHFPEEMPPGGKGPFSFDAVNITPEEYRIDNRTAIWEFTDFEPSEDICITWDWYGALAASDPFKLKSKAEGSALLLAQGRLADGQQALRAFATIREFFPDSVEARTIDYDIACVLWRHGVHARNTRHDSDYIYGHGGIDAKRAVGYYEAALKAPLDAEKRADALAELFLLYSDEVRNPARATQVFELLRSETIDPGARGLVLKVAAVSPEKAASLFASMAGEPDGGDYAWGIRADLKRLIRSHPNGLVKAQGEPRTRPAGEP